MTLYEMYLIFAEILYYPDTHTHTPGSWWSYASYNGFYSWNSWALNDIINKNNTSEMYQIFAEILYYCKNLVPPFQPKVTKWNFWALYEMYLNKDHKNNNWEMYQIFAELPIYYCKNLVPPPSPSLSQTTEFLGLYDHQGLGVCVYLGNIGFLQKSGTSHKGSRNSILILRDYLWVRGGYPIFAVLYTISANIWYIYQLLILLSL